MLAAIMAAQSPVLEIQVLEGEGAVHRAGSQETTALRVRITDQSGKPVPGALVTFRLPDDGPTGVFANQLNTEVVNAGPQGEAQTSAVRWNAVAGPLYLRVAALKGRLRAGTAVSQTIVDTNGVVRSTAAAPVVARPAQGQGSGSRLRSKWFIVALAAAAAGVAITTSWSRRDAGAQGSAGAVRIGTPSITIGKP
jgi:hypothetical protein